MSGRALVQNATVGDWITHTLPRHADPHLDTGGATQAVSIADLVGSGDTSLVARHAKLVADRVPAQAAAHYLCGWYAGFVAGLVGFGLITADAGLILDRDDVRFQVVDDGWPIRIDPGCFEMTVSSEHFWAKATHPSPEVRITSDRSTVVSAAVTGLVEVVTPLVTVCCSLGRVALRSLWDDVADQLGSVAAHRNDLTATVEMVTRLQEAVALPDAPWRRQPRLGWAHSEVLGPVHVAQRGGCCLAFTEAETTREEVADDLDAETVAYLRRFPSDGPNSQYCSTCRFRTPGDVDARQIFRAEWQHQRPSG